MEIGKGYKIVYKDQNYTKFASGKLIKEDSFILVLDDKDGKIGIGKMAIVSIRELEEKDGNRCSKGNE